jgi:hypothetical protein
MAVFKVVWDSGGVRGKTKNLRCCGWGGRRRKTTNRTPNPELNGFSASNLSDGIVTDRKIGPSAMGLLLYLVRGEKCDYFVESPRVTMLSYLSDFAPDAKSSPVHLPVGRMNQ